MVYSTTLEPSTGCSVTMKLFRNVKNVSDLRKKVVEGSLKCCIIKPSLIVDPFQITTAVNKAVVAEKMTTKTVYSETLFNLSISKNITQSLRSFGVSDEDSEIIVLAIHKNDCAGDADKIFAEVDGEEVDISVLKELTDRNALQKVYKLSEVEMKQDLLLKGIVSRIACKECL